MITITCVEGGTKLISSTIKHPQSVKRVCPTYADKS